jgi:hypothetical protein
MLSFLSEFWLLTLWSFDFLIYPPFCFVSIFLAINLAGSIVRQMPFRHDKWIRMMRLPLIIFLCFPATIAIAVVGYVDPPSPFAKPNTWGLQACNLLALIALVAGIYWTYRLKGLRWLAISVTLIQMWFLACANFIAGMALTGKWL